MSIHFSTNLEQSVCQHIQKLFAHFSHPTLAKNLLTLKAIQSVEKVSEDLIICLKMPFPWQKGFEALKIATTSSLKEISGCVNIHWQLNTHIATLKRANTAPAVKGVKNIIAITSGKGGVGKSTLAVNLSLALQAIGAKVGILDADIYGPSLPLMLGQKEAKPTSPDNKHMSPIKAHGLVANSIGFIIPAHDATIWRGPIASGALMQILNETLWAEKGQALDYLVIDMPPGTGDLQLTLSQQIPVTGAIVVTTPQDIALLDAIKGVRMFEKVAIPVLGIVENMSVHICSHCGHHEHIFGLGGAEKMAREYSLPMLAQLPLHLSLREDLDKGYPTLIRQPQSPISQIFLDLAERLVADLYWQGEVIPSEILFTEIQ